MHEFYVKLYILTFYLSFLYIIGFIIQRILIKTVLFLTGLCKMLLAYRSCMHLVQFVYHTSFGRLFQGLWVVSQSLIASWIARVRLSKYVPAECDWHWLLFSPDDQEEAARPCTAYCYRAEVWFSSTLTCLTFQQVRYSNLNSNAAAAE